MRVIAFLTAFAVMAVSWNATAGINTVAVAVHPEVEVDEGHYHQPTAAVQSGSGRGRPTIFLLYGDREYLAEQYRYADRRGAWFVKWFVNKEGGYLTLEDGETVGKFHFTGARLFDREHFADLAAWYNFPWKKLWKLTVPASERCGYQANIFPDFAQDSIFSYGRKFCFAVIQNKFTRPGG